MSDLARELLDRHEIHELRGAYSRALDYEDFERAHDIFTEDAVVKYRTGDKHGAQEVYEYWRDHVEYQFSLHTVQMPEIEVDGDEATGKWYMLVFYVAPDGRSGHVMGWYEDEYRRIDGTWKISRMDMGIGYDTAGYHT
ncbi:nuclear transport factor 2 family protein [Halorarius litoreus]|uniref:nuclear transport factor 2 family protein n=1 Tax=Halorarius litoreus TaxID=2962676 RepID=UPI0020CF7F84|nr:nuclear transport factor 2 family protein [Halorarius litoreus]